MPRRGVCECVSRRWRDACLALPSRVCLDVPALEDQGQSPAAALRSVVQGGRNVATVELLVHFVKVGGPPRAWQELADALPATVTGCAQGRHRCGRSAHRVALLSRTPSAACTLGSICLSLPADWT